MTFTRYHEISILNHLIKADFSQQKFGSSRNLCPKILQESIAQTTGCPSTRHLTPIITEMLGAHLCKLPCPSIQHFHHLCISPLLRRKDMSRPVFTTKRIGNIRSQHKSTFLADFLPVVSHRLEHSDTAIGCSTSAQSYDKVAHTPAKSIHHHLAHAPGSSLQRIALFRLYQSQSGSLCNLNYRRIIHDTILCLNPSHQGIMGMNSHSLSFHRREKGIEHSLSPITHFETNDFGGSIIRIQFSYFRSSLFRIPFLYSRSNRLIHLPARKATLIRVASYNNFPIHFHLIIIYLIIYSIAHGGRRIPARKISHYS